MKTESNVKPQTIEVNQLPDGMAEIVLCENVTELPGEDGPVYSYDIYIPPPIPWRDNLAAGIEANIDQWLDMARGGEPDTPVVVTDAQRLQALEAAVLEMAGELYG